jgi:charged multivesicular body protein 2A
MGARLSLEEQIKRDVRMMDRHCRVIKRDIVRMEREQKELSYKLKAKAKKGEMDQVTVLATRYMLFKVNIKKMMKLENHIENVKQRISMMGSVAQINEALQTLTVTMKAINTRMGVSSLNTIIRDYEKELTKVETNMERFDDVFRDDIDEEEQEDIVNSVLAEIGVEMDATMMSAPGTGTLSSNSDTTDMEKLLEEKLKSLAA